MRKIILAVVLALIISPVAVNALSVGTWSGWPTLGHQFNDKVSGYLSVSNNNPTTWYMIKADYNLAKLGDAQTKVGVYGQVTAPNNGRYAGVTWGASTMLVKNLSAGFDIILAEMSNSTGGSNNLISILPYATVAVNLYL